MVMKRKPTSFLKAYRGGDGSISSGSINPFNNQPYSEKYLNVYHDKFSRLPMNRPEIVKQLRDSFTNFQVTILTAETGAGKSTLISYHLLTYLREQYGIKSKVYVTQPRRLAAIGVSRGTALAMDVENGKEVGYKIGSDTKADESTRVLFVTEAILLNAYVANPNIPDLNAVIIDEAHERGLETDLVLLFTKLLVTSKSRPDLKVVIMSATANLKTFIDYFPGCNLVQVPGTAFPVKDVYLPRDPKDFIAAAVEEIVKICASSKDGDILTFFPGKNDNKKGCIELDKIRSKIKGTFHCIEFSSDISKNEDLNKKITEDPASSFGVDRKIIMATNVAEASVTIDGIVYVVDSGRANVSGFDAQTGIKPLIQEWIAKANARQRRGRCGRTQPGVCHRLFSKKRFDSFADYETPSILRSDLTSSLLQLFSMDQYSNANDLWALTKLFLSVPPIKSVRYSFEKFAVLGIMDSFGDITNMGKQIDKLSPLPIEMGRALLFANDFGCRIEMCEIAAILATAPGMLADLVENKKNIDKRLIDPDGEIFTLLRILRTARNLGKESTALTAFCRGYGIKQYVIENGMNDFYQKYKPNLEKMYDVLPPPYYVSEEPLQIEIPYFIPDKKIVSRWETSKISGSIRDRIIRCLIQGYFMNAVVQKRENGNESLRTIGTNLKVSGSKIKTKIGCYFQISSFRDKYSVTCLTEVKDITWFTDAARHYMPLVKFRL